MTTNDIEPEGAANEPKPTDLSKPEYVNIGKFKCERHPMLPKIFLISFCASPVVLLVISIGIFHEQIESNFNNVLIVPESINWINTEHIFMTIFGVVACLIAMTIISGKIAKMSYDRMKLKLKLWIIKLGVGKDYEFKVVPLEHITLGPLLGTGRISGVFQAEVKNLFAVGKKSIVAIKKLEEGHTDKDLSDLFHEMAVMKNIGRHENILDLLGCCSANGELMIIVECALNGCLKQYLEGFRNVDAQGKIEQRSFEELHYLLKVLLHFSWQIARGMEYLASKGCVHRDLAARNVLVDLSCTLKICDFGEARVIGANGYYQQTDDEAVPVRWLAPESWVDRKYDTRSDVWSYGILLWEIFTLGSQPYPSVEGFEILNFLRDGYRLGCPENCPLPIYKIMKDCWKYLPADRPTFADLVQNFADVMTPEGLDSLIESDVTLSASSLT